MACRSSLWAAGLGLGLGLAWESVVHALYSVELQPFLTVVLAACSLFPRPRVGWNYG